MWLLDITLLSSASFPPPPVLYIWVQEEEEKQNMFVAIFETPIPPLTNVQIHYFQYRKPGNPHLQNMSFNKFPSSQKAPGFSWDKPSYL